ncbi:MAG TPA: energy transducer TonB [Polyangia bacterium]
MSSASIVPAVLLAVSMIACSSGPPPRPSAPPPRYKLAFEPSDHEDTPCTEREPTSLLNALHTRVHNRINLPAGYLVVLPDGPQIGPLIQTDVMVAIHPSGRILKSVVTKPSGAPNVDQAVLTALQQAACMPVPPKELLDPSSNSMRVQVSYRFRRGK